MPAWLVKTEPETYSIDDLEHDGATLWDGVRNYQARNFLRDMQPGETVLIYHSNAAPSAIVGIGRVAERAIADPTQFDKQSQYFDSRSTRENPRWVAPEIAFVEKLPTPLALADLRKEPPLASMELLRKGSRLSVQPVKERELEYILTLANRE